MVISIRNSSYRKLTLLPIVSLNPTDTNYFSFRPYPIRRALPLVEAISRDLNEQLLKVLHSQRLMYTDYATFEKSMSLCSAVFTTWDDSIKEFTNVAREVTRKRSEKFLPIKIRSASAGLEERVGYLRGFRKSHWQLTVMVGPLGKERGRVMIEGGGGGGERGTDIDMDAEVSFFSLLLE